MLKKRLSTNLPIKFTATELSIIDYLASGLTSHAIAEKVFRSKRTVEGKNNSYCLRLNLSILLCWSHSPSGMEYWSDRERITCVIILFIPTIKFLVS